MSLGISGVGPFIDRPGYRLSDDAHSSDIAIIARGNARTLAQSTAIVESNIASFKEAVLQIRELERSRGR